MKILLTGANGYIGMRLLPLLIENKHEVVCFVRDRRRLSLPDEIKGQLEIYEVDLLEEFNIENLPKDIDVAYYLVHSMTSSDNNFGDLEKRSAENFCNYINYTRTQQIIYLSGIANDENLSPHLSSRKRVEFVLRQSNVPVTVLRAGIILGSGSASFEIIRDLVEKLPIMITPKWLNTRCQPIAISDVINYLYGAMGKKETYNQNFDIGGNEILTYKQMLLKFAEVRELKRLILTIPVLTPRLSSLWLYFVTSTSYTLARHLVDSMKNEIVCNNNKIRDIVPIQITGYKEAIQLAFKKIEQNLVLSSWKDALIASDHTPQLLEFVSVPTYGCFIDKRTERTSRENIKKIEDKIWSIGGDQGWYYANILWKIRGVVDKLVGGVGLRRGRRSPDELYPGDALDFWRVLIADRDKLRLLLYAEMKLPGEAWLEFNIEKDKNSLIVNQIATFRPKGIFGRLYWWSLYPVHQLIFGNMLKKIAI